MDAEPEVASMDIGVVVAIPIVDSTSQQKMTIDEVPKLQPMIIYDDDSEMSSDWQAGIDF